MTAIIRLAAMGDAMLDRTVGKNMREHPELFELEDIRHCLAPCEIVFANLETPVAFNGKPDAVQHPNVTFRSHPRSLNVLKKIGVNVVSLANNHMLDYGEAALLETMEHLEAAGIKHVGAGRNWAQANRPLLLEVNGGKFAFLAQVMIYSASTRRATRKHAGVADYRLKTILPVIRELHRSGYRVIVSQHWGMEYAFFPLPYQMSQARRMIDAGAVMILGHGPHYPQGIEHHHGGTIIYSLGNFMFDEPHRFANRSFIYQAGIMHDGRLTEQRIHPFEIHEGVPRLLSGVRRTAMVGLIEGLGAGYKKKKPNFWRKINNRYFSATIGRVVPTRSIKYIFLPPLSFYRSIGIKNFLAKFSISNLQKLFGHKTDSSFPVLPIKSDKRFI